MNGYLISTADRSGLVASVLREAAARGVNIYPAYAMSDGSTALMLLGSDDEAGLQAAISASGVRATPMEMVTTELENRVGSGAELFARLADAGVDLRAAVPIGPGSGNRVQLALAATDPAALKRALGG